MASKLSAGQRFALSIVFTAVAAISVLVGQDYTAQTPQDSWLRSAFTTAVDKANDACYQIALETQKTILSQSR